MSAGDLGTISVVFGATTKTYPIDTSFEPYRREAFRQRSDTPQREGIMMTNVPGEGTVSTEGLWRRGQIEWNMGAGQYSLDRRGDAQENRFLKSKGVDVFSFPFQASLLPDTYQKVANAGANLLMARCGDYVMVASGAAAVTRYSSAWGASACTFDTTTNAANTASGTITAPSTVRSVTANGSYTFLATDTGIWYNQTATSTVFQLFSDNDASTGFTGGYDMVRWVNDQLIGSRYARLYAFQARGGATSAPYGAPPTILLPITGLNIVTIGTSNLYPAGLASVDTVGPHGLTPGQRLNIAGTSAFIAISSLGTVASGSAVLNTLTGAGIYGNGAAVGETIKVYIQYTDGSSRTFSAKVTAATTSSVTIATNKISTTKTFSNGYFDGADGYDYNADFTVVSVDGTYNYRFYITRPTTNPSYESNGGTISQALVQGSPDVLYTHETAAWVWSDACGGETQVYLAGYVKSNGVPSHGCIYRSAMLGSDVSTATNTGTIATSSVFQPFQLNSPVQALPMSPDEYPTCVKTYLNYVFVGTNRGIRMCQTLSVYDPTATATGDLKAGPFIPNKLQPVTVPVTAIIGDGQYVWFAWNNYDGSSTGLGKLDLTTYIAGDPLAPAYASDLMVTGQGNITSLVWDPSTNVPVMAVQNLGLYMPYASNTGGIPTVSQYVPSATLVSGIFDYGVPDFKIPIFFDYGAVAANGSSVAASIVTEPNDPTLTTTIAVGAFTSGGATEVSVTNTKAREFQVTLTLTSDSGHTHTPYLHRWTLKSWPCIVQPVLISAVLSLSGVVTINGQETGQDPYAEKNWLWARWNAQDLMTYQEGSESVPVVIFEFDWIPHKARGTFEGGFEGDMVVYFKTLGPYTYTAPVTS